ncbi:MAG: HD domain-containing protein [Candidatus Thorarchaeota archaeon]|nr:HD domain-containing protein [Candidatus Thorarchaeota archaeon]
MKDRNPGISKAVILAINAHDGAYRGDGVPYVVHPIRVALHAASIGLSQQAIIASLLHDVVEDTDTPISEIYSTFGDDVGDMVAALTKPAKGTPNRTNVYEHQLLEGPPESRMIKLLDIQDNLSDIDEYFEPEKAASYRMSREALADKLRASLHSMESE